MPGNQSETTRVIARYIRQKVGTGKAPASKTSYFFRWNNWNFSHVTLRILQCHSIHNAVINMAYGMVYLLARRKTMNPVNAMIPIMTPLTRAIDIVCSVENPWANVVKIDCIIDCIIVIPKA